MITMSAPMALWNLAASWAECESTLRKHGATGKAYIHACYRFTAAMRICNLFGNGKGLSCAPNVFLYSQRIQPVNHGPCCRYAAAVLANVTKGKPMPEPSFSGETPGYSHACGYHD